MFLNTVAFWLSIMALVSVLLKSLCITDETDRDVTLYTSKYSGVLALYMVFVSVSLKSLCITDETD